VQITNSGFCVYYFGLDLIQSVCLTVNVTPHIKVLFVCSFSSDTFFFFMFESSTNFHYTSFKHICIILVTADCKAVIWTIIVKCLLCCYIVNTCYFVISMGICFSFCCCDGMDWNACMFVAC